MKKIQMISEGEMETLREINREYGALAARCSRASEDDRRHIQEQMAFLRRRRECMLEGKEERWEVVASGQTSAATGY